jgi:hypothetical protein
MAFPSSDQPAAAAPAPPWIRNACWDGGCLAFCWLPFYIWVVFGLGIDGSGAAGQRHSLAWAMAVALAATYVHRHYTFVLVYGDRDTFRVRARDFVLAPLVVFAVIGVVRGLHGALRGDPDWRWFGAGAWQAVMVTVGVWNVWHTLMQRYGILRIYAGKAGHGLQARDHGRRDLALLWASVILVSWSTLLLRGHSFAGQTNARQAWKILEPLTVGLWPWLLLAALVIAWLAVVGVWLSRELRADLAWSARVPRWTFLASTFALLAVFVVHGPIVGYLCFGVAHALEYVAFVHHFGQQKFARDPARRSPASLLLRRPLQTAPLLVGGLLLAFVLLYGQRQADVYLVYYIGTSMLHFLFDGWIWKVRRPEVRAPLGVT